ncbi:MAG: hypothetical protein ABI204_03180 [Ginsengibacter sp.]
MSIKKVLNEARDGDKVQVTIVTNQNDGIASYTVGTMKFKSRSTGLEPGPQPFHSQYFTSTPESLTTYFSDRFIDINAANSHSGPPSIHVPLNQPFSINATEHPEITLSSTNILSFGLPLSLTINIFGHKHVIHLQEMGDVLVGEGQILWGNVPNAVYIVAFTKLSTPKGL